jgi:hypothetical protein
MGYSVRLFCFMAYQRIFLLFDLAQSRFVSSNLVRVMPMKRSSIDLLVSYNKFDKLISYYLYTNNMITTAAYKTYSLAELAELDFKDASQVLGERVILAIDDLADALLNKDSSGK